MAYSELIKNFNKIRDYMRDFYVYGFKSREEYTRKSPRSYDDERRRMESWLGEYMRFRHTPEGKQVFLSIDSRAVKHNPLFKAWKTKSFTDGDITLHFLLMDILADGEELPLTEIAARVDTYLSSFSEARVFDQSTVRKKLNEYVKEGLLTRRKSGKTYLYSRSEEETLPDGDILDYFSEVSPCGVVGSFLLDRTKPSRDMFSFKHHYITGTLDSQVLCDLFDAMGERRSVTLELIRRGHDRMQETNAVPLKIMVSVQSGRQYLMAYVPKYRRVTSFRLDYIVSVKKGEVCENFQELREMLTGMKTHIWGVSTNSRSGSRMEHVEFTIRYGENELHIPRRLEREKRGGKVEHLDNNISRFSIDVFDASELVPWIRTFICRIIDISFSNEALERQFREDIRAMYALYGMEGGEDDAVS